MLEFLPDGDARSQAIPFASFKSLCLERPVTVGRLRLAMPAANVEAFPSPAHADFTIRYQDGTALSAPIVGIVARRYGLFPYLVDATGGVLRWFMPAEVTAGCRIGDPLGRMLVERGVVAAQSVEAGLARQRAQRATRFGEYLCQSGVVTREQVETCLDEQRGSTHLRIGEVLVARGCITAAQRDHALAQQQAERDMPLGEILVLMGLVGRRAVRQTLADQFGVPWVSLDGFRFEREALEAIPVALVRRHLAMPLYRTQSRLVLAVRLPVDWNAVEEIEGAANLKVDAVLASNEDIGEAIERYYGRR
jgi:hypothetical protein